jgi:hypothetical protein
MMDAVSGHVVESSPASAPHTLVKVRAITNFVQLPPDQSVWPKIISRATTLAAALVATYTELGYTTQTLRIVANPFGEWLDCTSLDGALAGLAALKAILSADTSGIRIRFAIGAAQTPAELLLVPQMIAAFGDLCNICLNVGKDEAGLVDAHMCSLAADTVVELAKCTERGEGNFNFTVNFAW